MSNSKMFSSNSPRVSVFIPTYNRLEMLKRAVASVLSQDVPLRLHILDNASPDGTAQWLRSLQNRDDRIDLTLREKNAGGLVNFTEGFTGARTEYLIPLADDDELATNFLKQALPIAEADPALGAVVFRTESRSNSGRVQYSPASVNPGRLPPREHLMRWVKSGHYVSWSSILWRRDLFQRFVTAGELSRLPFSSDVWLQFLVFSESPVYLSDQVGSIFNEHDQQVSKNPSIAIISEFGQLIDLMDSHLKSLELFEPDQRQEFLRLQACNFSNSLKYLVENTRENLSNDLLSQVLAVYSKTFVPRTGLDFFPFLSLVPQFLETQDLLGSEKASLKLAVKQQQTLAWRLLSPLAAIEAVLKGMVPSPIKVAVKKFVSRSS